LDNITHTLVGVLVGETAARATRSNASGLGFDTRRNVFVTLMAIGSNVPDLDFIQSRITGNKLEYLLHHRGHTHTIIGALIVAALLYLACEAWCRWRRHSLSRTDRVQIAGIASLSTLLHIAMDATNSYGVHPFWPFDNRWYYGDAVFIVEPLFWAACAPLVFTVRSMTAKVLISLTLIAGIVLSFTTGMVPVLMSTVLVILTLAMLTVGRLASKQAALVTGLLVWFAINASFAQASAIARRKVQTIAAQRFPQARLLDTVLTPMPANPICWQVLLVQMKGDEWYVRRASLSIRPELLAADACPSRGNAANTTAPFSAIPAPNTATITWHGEIGMSRARLIEWVERDCQVAELMRFARAPWLTQRDGVWILGDARFDNEPGLSFAEIELGSDAPCMARVPPWVPPRRDLLSVGR